MRHTKTLLSCLISSVILQMTAMAPAAPAQPPQTWSLAPERTPGVVDHVQITLEVSGQLSVTENDKLRSLPLKVAAELEYDERSLEVSTGSSGKMRAMRQYGKAVAAIQVDGRKIRATLREQRQLIGVQSDGPKVTLYSPHGPLTREELDLLDVQGNSLLLDHLLPDSPVGINDTWSHDDLTIQALLGPDAIHRSEVTSKLVSVTDGVALVEIEGQVEAAVQGVSTEIELRGKYQFNLATKRIPWFGLLVKEKRAASHVGPGLDVVARLQMKITRIARSDTLTNAALEGLALSPTDELRLLSYAAPQGAWEFTHDRRWFSTVDQADRAVFRLIDRGELVAQCNVSPSSSPRAGRPVSLTDFQNDVKQSLGENFGQFVRASQRAGDRGYRVYQVEIDGMASELPIRWIYYLLANQQGHEAVLVFTIEGSLLERFDNADGPLLESIRLRDDSLAAKP